MEMDDHIRKKISNLKELYNRYIPICGSKGVGCYLPNLYHICQFGTEVDVRCSSSKAVYNFKDAVVPLLALYEINDTSIFKEKSDNETMKTLIKNIENIEGRKITNHMKNLFYIKCVYPHTTLKHPKLSEEDFHFYIYGFSFDTVNEAINIFSWVKEKYDMMICKYYDMIQIDEL